jgi:hypothetical protein
LCRTLFAGIGGDDGFAFGFDGGQPATFATAQQVVGAVAVRQGVFVADAHTVTDLPVLISKLGIDERPCKGFSQRHGFLEF